MKKVRITVIKKRFYADLVAKHMAENAARTFKPCGHEIGESFVVGQPVMCPDGMCPWAWHDVESVAPEAGRTRMSSRSPASATRRRPKRRRALHWTQ